MARQALLGQSGRFRMTSVGQILQPCRAFIEGQEGRCPGSLIIREITEGWVEATCDRCPNVGCCSVQRLEGVSAGEGDRPGRNDWWDK